MALVAAKCPNCGANLEVDRANEAANCEFCGAAFIVEKAINNYNITNAHMSADVVNINIGADEKSLIEYAESIINVNPNEALNKYKQALSINPKNWAAWFGVVKANVCIEEKTGELSSLVHEHILAKYGIYRVIQATSRYGSNNTPPYISGGFRYNKNEEKNAYENALNYAPDENYEQIMSFYETKVTAAKEQAEKHRADIANSCGSGVKSRDVDMDAVAVTIVSIGAIVVLVIVIVMILRAAGMPMPF